MSSGFEKRLVSPRSALDVAAVLVSLVVFIDSLFVDFLPIVSGAYSDQRFVLIAIMLTVLMGTLSVDAHRSQLRQSVVSLWPFAPLVLSFLAGLLQLRDVAFSSVEPVFYALYFLAFALLGYRLSHRRSLSTIIVGLISTLVASCFFYAAMTMTVYLFAITDDFSKLDHVIPWGFVNIRYWSHVASWVIPLFPLAILMGPLKNHQLWRAGVAFTAAIWWWMVFMSVSRGTMVGVVIGLACVVVMFGRAARPWAMVSVRYAVYGLGAWLVLSLVVPGLVFDSLQIRSLHADSSGRLPLWQEAWAMSLQNFPFGMGPQSWLTHDIITEAYRSSPKFGHPHNMYLMWAAEYGWVSVLGIVIIGGVAAKRLWKKRAVVSGGANPDGLALVAFTASVTAALVHAGVSAVFIAPASMLVGLVVLSVFWALICEPESQSHVQTKPASGLTGQIVHYGFVLIVAAGGVWWVNQVLNYHRAMIDDIPYYQKHVTSGDLPRFWFHGNFPRPSSLMPPAENN